MNNDIKRIYRLFMEEKYGNFSSRFCDFILSLKNYISGFEIDSTELKVLKFKLELFLKSLENEGSIISKDDSRSVLNSINELIFSTKLNEINSCNGEVNFPEKLNEVYKAVSDIIFFDLPDGFDSYKFWCFLKMAEYLKTIYDENKNDFTDGNFKESMSFVFRNKTGDFSQLIYDFSNISITVGETGKTPVYFKFLFEEDEEEPSLFYKTKKFRLFSQKFLLSEEKKDNAVCFSPENTKDIEALLHKITSYSNALRLETVSMALNESLNQYEIERQNVLVACVRSEEQFAVNFKGGFYHMPVSAYNVEDIPLEYLAIYFSHTKFSEESGIKYYGKIKNISIVHRREITELPKDSSDLYYRFSVDWYTLPKTLKSTGSIPFFLASSYFMLMEAENASELYVKKYDEYLTLKFFKKYDENVSIKSENGHISSIRTKKLKMNFSVSIVSLDKGWKEVFVMDRVFYKNHLNKVLKQIKEDFFGEKD